MYVFSTALKIQPPCFTYCSPIAIHTFTYIAVNIINTRSIVWAWVTYTLVSCCNKSTKYNSHLIVILTMHDFHCITWLLHICNNYDPFELCKWVILYILWYLIEFLMIVSYLSKYYFSSKKTAMFSNPYQFDIVHPSSQVYMHKCTHYSMHDKFHHYDMGWTCMDI